MPFCLPDEAALHLPFAVYQQGTDGGSVWSSVLMLCSARGFFQHPQHAQQLAVPAQGSLPLSWPSPDGWYEGSRGLGVEGPFLTGASWGVLASCLWSFSFQQQPCCQLWEGLERLGLPLTVHPPPAASRLWGSRGK